MPDDHSASRRVEVLEREAPHLLADDRAGRAHGLRLILLLTLATDAALVGLVLVTLGNYGGARIAFTGAAVCVVVAGGVLLGHTVAGRR